MAAIVHCSGCKRLCPGITILTNVLIKHTSEKRPHPSLAWTRCQKELEFNRLLTAPIKQRSKLMLFTFSPAQTTYRVRGSWARKWLDRSVTWEAYSRYMCEKCSRLVKERALYKKKNTHNKKKNPWKDALMSPLVFGSDSSVLSFSRLSQIFAMPLLIRNRMNRSSVDLSCSIFLLKLSAPTSFWDPRRASTM